MSLSANDPYGPFVNGAAGDFVGDGLGGSLSPR